MRIGIFDSGVGGLTVLKTLIEKYPMNEYIYYGDTLNIPYGSKTIGELEILSDKDVKFLIEKQVDMIIIACGTVSSNCLNYLRRKYNIPIYDIISPTIKYLNESNYSNILVIATERTIDSHIFKNNLLKNVIEIITPSLVPLIESNNLDNIDDELEMYFSEYKDKIDVLVLGCTHYPVIRQEISNYFGNKIDVLDMSSLLVDKIEDGKISSVDIYFSKLNSTIIDNVKKILELDDVNIYESKNC